MPVKGDGNKKFNSENDTRQQLKEFEQFLITHKVTGQGVPYTHSAFGHPWGKYDIPDNKLDEFYELYGKMVEAKVDLHLIERPKNIGPLLIDIDLHFTKDHKERQYTQDDIKYIIHEANVILKKYLKLTKKMLRSFIFEKKEPSYHEKNRYYKDGFHIVYPFIGLDKGMRYLILDDLKCRVQSKDGFERLPFINGLDDVFDTCVVSKNGWTMNGSRKEGGQFYRLTHIYNYDCKESDTNEFQEEELHITCSNRKFDDDDIVPLKESVNKANTDKKVQRLLEKNGEFKKKKKAEPIEIDMDDDEDDSSDSDSEDDTQSSRRKKKSKGKSKDKHRDNYNIKKKSGTDDVSVARKLANILSRRRATSYASWIQVGWALHNVSPDLLDAFKKFSKKCGEKYDAHECEKVWDKARDDGYTIKSLHWWAKKDDVEGYLKVMRESINELFEEAETGTEYDVAKIIHELYKYQYTCSSLKNNIWYEFQGHRWVEVESGYTLNTKLSEEITQEFALLNSALYAQGAAESGVDREATLKRAGSITKVMMNLKRSGFKGRVMEECSRLFYDKGFEELLDSNTFLIGFDNGVFDLRRGCFRAGTPDDYLTYSVGYDYEEYNFKDKVIGEILEYFKKVQREEDMREYILTLLASYLDGNIRDQKFILWTGSGSNGKSKTVEFYQLAYGDYCGVLPVTVLTRKRGGSGAATPELAELKGKRFVVFQEPESDDTIHVGFMKELTGGDTIYARPLFKDPIKYKPQFKLLLTCNKLPYIPSTDGGTWRRLRVSPFDSEFVDLDTSGKFDGVPLKEHQFPKDYELDDKFEQWKGAFMWLLLNHYYKIYIKKGLNEPEKVQMRTKKYKKDSDIYLEFIDEHLDLTGKKNDFESLDVIYQTFKAWHRESYAGTSTPSKKEMKEYLVNHDYKCDVRYLYGAKFFIEEEPKHQLDD